jgi:hypothetical protein
MKHGGRKAGVPNRITSDIRQLLSEAVHEYLQSDLNALQPSKRAELIVRMLPYILPPAIESEPLDDVEPLTLVLTREVCSRCNAE